MKINVWMFVCCFLVSSFSAQTLTPSFEGEIVYAVTYKSKLPQLKAENLSAMLGSVHNYYYRGGDYKMVTNGLYAQWQLYINKDNKLYNKMASSDTVFWNDASFHDDEVLSTQFNKNVVTIQGYLCNELVLTCRSGVHKYYYNADIAVDSRLFVKHRFGNYYNVVSRIHALPLKMIIEERDFSMESTATKIEAKKIKPTFFTLPANTKTAVSVY